MTKAEAAKIPDLQIHPDELVEDCFYCQLAMKGLLSDEQGRKAANRIAEMAEGPKLFGAIIVADMMVKNLERYGCPCVDWAE